RVIDDIINDFMDNNEPLYDFITDDKIEHTVWKIDNDDINLLENYVLANGIKGKKWFDEKWDYRITQSLSGQESEFELELK
ncbi:hypothetical protein BM531_21455, partial [Clostridioides difficile]